MPKDLNLVTRELPANEAKGSELQTTISSLVQVDLAALSHPGKVRSTNEDYYLVARLERAMRTMFTNLSPGSVPDRSEETGYGIVVADGMDGDVGGEIASSTAVEVLVDLVLRTPDWIMRFDETSVNEALRRADQRFSALKETLIQKAKADPSLSGMGTTLTLAYSLGATLAIAHVGDSRAYLFRHGVLRRLTHDQTMADLLAEVGAIRHEDVAQHPMRHVLLGAIATQGETAKPELIHLRLVDGDQLLLCTDGLTEMVSDAEIGKVLIGSTSAAEACRVLVDSALAAGGNDNVTVVLGRYQIPK
jgi:protein phosphatase